MEVRLTGDDVAGMLGILRREFEGRRRTAMGKAVRILKPEAQARIHSPEGKARRGIGYEVRGSGESLRGILRSRNRAAIFSQRDRAAGKKAPPVRVIRAWLRRKGQDVTPSSAFLVARAIGRQGFQGRPVMADTLRAKREEVLAVFQRMLRDALRRR